MSLFAINNFQLLHETSERLCYSGYEAIDLDNGRAVEVKILKPAITDNQVATASFIHNAHLLKGFNHPVFQKVYAGGCVDGHYYIATEPITHEPLEALVLDTFSLQTDELIKIFSTLGDALRFSHLRGLMHGLLNPRCIQINKNCELIVSDLGFNWYSPLLFTQETAESQYVARYVPPESFLETWGIERCDIYSLGVMLYELINGHPPYDGASVEEIRAKHEEAKPLPLRLEGTELPDGLNAIINQALQIGDVQPFQNIADFVDALVNVGEKGTSRELFEINDTVVEHFSAPIPKRRLTLPAITLAKISPKPAFLLATAVVLLLLALFSIPGWFDSRQPSNAVTTEIRPLNPNGEAIPPPVKTDSNLASKSAVNISGTQTLPKQPGVRIDDEPPVNTPSRDAIAVKHLPEADASQPDSVSPTSAIDARFASLQVISEGRGLVANVFIDDAFIGETDTQGFITIPDLLPGKSYLLHLSREGMISKNLRFQRPADQETVVVEMARLDELTGTMIIDVTPGADEIYIDGQIQDEEPPLRLQLKWGKHNIRLVNRQLNKTWEDDIALKIGQILRIRHDFTVQETGNIAVSVKNAEASGYAYIYINGELCDDNRNTTPLQISLPVGRHTVELKRDGYEVIPKDIVVTVAKNETKSVSFNLRKLDSSH